MTSRCIALVVAHVNKQIYYSEFSCTYSAPVKSTPVTVEVGVSKVLVLGRGGEFGVAYRLPPCGLHMVH